MTRPGRPWGPAPDGAAPDGEPEWWRRSSVYRRVPIVAAVILVIILIRAGQGTTPPPLKTSCTTPAFALSSYSVSSHTAVQWSVTGPAQSQFTLTIGAAGLQADADGRLTPVPADGVAAHDVRSTGVASLSSSCTAHGTFGVVLPAGRYAVRLFRVSDVGTGGASATQVSQKTLTVTS